MSREQRLKRLLYIDIQTCSACSDTHNVIRSLLSAGRGGVSLGPGKKMKTRPGKKPGNGPESVPESGKHLS